MLQEMMCPGRREKTIQKRIYCNWQTYGENVDQKRIHGEKQGGQEYMFLKDLRRRGEELDVL